MSHARPLDLTGAITKLLGKLHGWAEDFIVMLPNLTLAAMAVVVALFASRWLPRVAEPVFHRTTNNARRRTARNGMGCITPRCTLVGHRLLVVPRSRLALGSKSGVRRRRGLARFGLGFLSG